MGMVADTWNFLRVEADGDLEFRKTMIGIALPDPSCVASCASLHDVQRLLVV